MTMLDWKADLDALVIETMAFAKTVRSVKRMTSPIIGEADRRAPVNWIGSEREEIARRVADFKAHQQRLKREREDFAASEFKRMLAPAAPQLWDSGAGR
jgi:hypothetical protein